WLFFFQAEDGIRDGHVTGVQTCALPICPDRGRRKSPARPRQPRSRPRGLAARSTGCGGQPHVVHATPPPPTTRRRRIEPVRAQRSEEHTSELQSRGHLVCRLLLEKKKK